LHALSGWLFDDACRNPTRPAINWKVTYDHRARPYDGTCADSDSGYGDNPGTQERLLADDHVSSQRRPGRDVRMRTDLAIMIDAAGRIQNCVLANTDSRIYRRAGQQYCPDAYLAFTPYDCGWVHDFAHHISTRSRVVERAASGCVVTDSHHQDDSRRARETGQRTNHRYPEDSCACERVVVVHERERLADSSGKRCIAHHLSVSARAHDDELQACSPVR
jgi:hypothetical protein